MEERKPLCEVAGCFNQVSVIGAWPRRADAYADSPRAAVAVIRRHRATAGNATGQQKLQFIHAFLPLKTCL